MFIQPRVSAMLRDVTRQRSAISISYQHLGTYG